MKKLLFFSFAIILVFFTGATPTLAKFNTKEYIKLGAPNEQYGYPQGMTAAGKELYVMDSIVIRKWDGKRFSDYFDLKKLGPDLKAYGLQDPETIHSFRLAQMQVYKNELYVSGLMFLNLENKKMTYRDSLVNGYTYNVVFKVTGGKAKLLQVNHAKINIGFTPFDVFETEDGRPGDLYEWGKYTLYDYAKYTPYPHFTFYKDDMILVQRVFTKDEAEKTPLNQVISLGKKTEVLYEWRGSVLPSQFGDCNALKCGKYRIPVRDGDMLTLYDGESGVHKIDLKTKKSEDLFMPEEFLLERPYWTGKEVYFLNDFAVFFMKEEDKEFAFYGKYAEEFDFSGDIAGYAVTDTNIYILNFDTRTIHKYDIRSIS